MKKTTLSILFALSCINMNAYDVEVNGIYYNLIKKAKAAEVTYSYSNPYSGELVIPSEFEYEGVTYKVTAINGVGMHNRIESVSIPNTVTFIDKDAFYSSESLKEIIIPNSVTSIGDDAFSSCKELTKVSLPSEIKEIPDGLFKFSSKLETVNIPKGVTLIGIEAFWGCSALKSLELPFGLNTIGARAFKGCKSLTEIDIPTAMFVGVEAFYGCKNLRKIVLRELVVSIFSKAFADCEELSDVYCYQHTTPIIFSEDLFYDSQTKYATLHVKDFLIDEYKKTKPWSEFGAIVALTDEETGVSIQRKEEDDSIEQILKIDGKSRSELQKGLNIIVQKNGKVKKLFVK